MLLTTVFIIRLFWLQLNLVCVINLGPSFDHTTKTTKGWYLYIEASAPRVPREFARINYRFPSPSTAGCFSMHFHMYGSQLGVLRVDLTTTDHKTFVAWRNNRFATADRWQKVSINIPATTTEVNVQIISQDKIRIILVKTVKRLVKMVILKK